MPLGQNAVENNDLLAIDPDSIDEYGCVKGVSGAPTICVGPAGMGTLVRKQGAVFLARLRNVSVSTVTSHAAKEAVKNATISGSISATSQAVQSKGDLNKVNWRAVVVDTATGGIASKYGLGGQLITNTTGSAVSAKIQGQNPAEDIPGTLVGTFIGNKAGTGITKSLNPRFNPIGKSRDVYVPFNPILKDTHSNIPTYLGTFGSGVSGEASKTYINNQIKQRTSQ